MKYEAEILQTVHCQLNVLEAYFLLLPWCADYFGIWCSRLAGRSRVRHIAWSPELGQLIHHGVRTSKY